MPTFPAAVADIPVKIVSRSAITVEPRQPFMEWAQQLQPDQPLPPAAFEPGLYLLPLYDSRKDAIELLEQGYEEIFCSELETWLSLVKPLGAGGDTKPRPPHPTRRGPPEPPRRGLGAAALQASGWGPGSDAAGDGVIPHRWRSRDDDHAPGATTRRAVPWRSASKGLPESLSC